MKAKIPTFLRIDKDIQAKQEYLDGFYKKYQKFDIEDLRKSVHDKLQRSIDDASHDFIVHKESVTTMLVKGEETNKNSDTLQGQIVRNRLENIQNITQTMEDSKRMLQQYDTQDSKKQ